MITGAILSMCGTYRYSLTRSWAQEGGVGKVLWIMLNPSTADASLDDPTIRRCIGFSKAWAYAELEVCNLFALRSTDPSAIYEAADPVGEPNDAAIREAACKADAVVAAWGTFGGHLGRDKAVMKIFTEVQKPPRCLGITMQGFPKHPLYVAGATPLVNYYGGRP